MQKLITQIFFNYCIISIYCLSLTAQTTLVRPIVKQKEGSKNLTTLNCFSSEKINLKLEKLPLNYHGNNLKSIIEEIERRRNLTKDEFETTKQFLERKESEHKKPLIGELTLQSLLAAEAENVSFSYDADSEMMSSRVASKPIVKWVSPCGESDYALGLMITPILELRKNRSTYEDFDLNHKNEYLTGKFKIELNLAKQTKPNLRALYILSIIPRDGEYIPVEGYDLKRFNRYAYSSLPRKYINAEIKEIWIYDVSTGRIWNKQKPNENVYDLLQDKSALELNKKLESDLQKSRDLYKAGRDDEALIELRRIIADNPMNAESYYLIGSIHLRRGDVEPAVSNLKTAVFWKNDLVEGHVALGKIFLERADYLQAGTYAKNALQIQPNNPEAIALTRQIERKSK